MNANLRDAYNAADRVAPNGVTRPVSAPYKQHRLDDDRMLRIKLLPENVAVLEELLRGLGDPQPGDWIEEFVDRNKDSLTELKYDVVAVYNSYEREVHYARKEEAA